MMTQGKLQTGRRNLLAAFVAGIAVSAAAMPVFGPGPRAKIELTTARVSVLLETGPVRFRTAVFDSAQAAAKPVGLIVTWGLLGE